MPRFIIAGLGNYTHPKTRHSVGQVALASLAAMWNITLKYERGHSALVGRKEIELSGVQGPVDVTLVKPKLLMNVSGAAIVSVLRAFPSEIRSSRNLIVLQDSLSHPELAISPKFNGSANGHNGVRSVISSLQRHTSDFPQPRPTSEEFYRIRLGIGRPAHKDADVADYVLRPLSKKELDWWSYGGPGLNKIVKALEAIMSKKPEEA